MLEKKYLKKKQNIIEVATHLFAKQGFDGTTTHQIAKEAGVTEPLIYYHFKGKDELFNCILENMFDTYFCRLASLDHKTKTEFEKIESLIRMHFQFVAEMPDETYLGVSECPAKLKNKAHVCGQNIDQQRSWLFEFLSKKLQTGIQTGIQSREFITVPVKETVNLLIAMINGLLRQRGLHLAEL
jgi:AcrR family transcriptional regulator